MSKETLRFVIQRTEDIGPQHVADCTRDFLVQELRELGWEIVMTENMRFQSRLFDGIVYSMSKLLPCIVLCFWLSACAIHISPVDIAEDGTMECEGIDWAIGDATSCGTSGGNISVPFARLVKEIAVLARSLLPGGIIRVDQPDPGS